MNPHEKSLLGPIFSKEVWMLLILTVLSTAVLFSFVNLTPKVDNDFFFSSDDPIFANERRISSQFTRRDTQLIINVKGNIETPTYQKRIERLTTGLESIPGVTAVKSLSQGPDNLNHAKGSPLWRRIILSEANDSTNIIIILEESRAQQVASVTEELASSYDEPDFEVTISGVPYIVMLIQRNLKQDFSLFSVLAFIIFGIVILVTFRSLRVFIGTMVTCANACMWTFMAIHLIGAKIGILTANLATITFVLTLSHIVFVTYSWKSLCSENTATCQPVGRALKLTFPGSFWSMFTTLLGFLSLLAVPAKPLRELGVAGSLATLISLATAYGVYPAFLRIKKTPLASEDLIGHQEYRLYSFLNKHKRPFVAVMVAACIICLPGLKRLNTDPSFFAYFKQDGPIARGLYRIDQNGGSNPLIAVVKMASGSKLDTNDAYRSLWTLQEALEKHPKVGTVISLPVLMAQAKRAPLAFFLRWDWLISILETDYFGRIARSFISEDHSRGLFLLRMKELHRTQERLTTVDEIHSIIKKHGFHPDILGGVYVLQGHMASLVASSLIYGLFRLLLVFFLISWIVARSARLAWSMVITVCFIPLIVLGAIGKLQIPLDIISAPATNVAIAMGIDSMIHMVIAYRRKRKEGAVETDAWLWVGNHLWQPILTAMLIIVLGFSIFMFSTFPPTRRFGGAIMFGTLVAAISALIIMPLLARLRLSD